MYPSRMKKTIGHAADTHFSLTGPGNKKALKEFRHDAAQCDVVVLCGDICSRDGFSLAMDWLDDFPCPAVFVPGNHEFYGATRSHGLDVMRNEAGKRRNVVFLDNDVATISGIRLAGSTGWWDASAFRFRPSSRNRLNDFAMGNGVGIYDIMENDSGLAWGREAYRFLDRATAEVPTVVVTHVPPHPSCIPAQWTGDDANVFFANDWSSLFGKNIPLWFFGHTHASYDGTISGTRLLSNPCVSGKREFDKVEIHI